MPWNVRDYPASMKNLDPLVRKKRSISPMPC